MLEHPYFQYLKGVLKNNKTRKVISEFLSSQLDIWDEDALISEIGFLFMSPCVYWQRGFSWSCISLFFSCVKDQQNGCSRVHCGSWQAPCFPGKSLSSIWSEYWLETIITQDCFVFSKLYSLVNPRPSWYCFECLTGWSSRRSLRRMGSPTYCNKGRPSVFP